MVPTDVASHVLFHFEWGLSQCANLKSPSGDERPNVELTILCHRLMHSVMASVECSLIYSKPKQFSSPSEQIDTYGSQTIKVKAVSLPLETGRLPVQVYAVYVLPNPGIYLGYRCSSRPNDADLCEGILPPSA